MKTTAPTITNEEILQAIQSLGHNQDDMAQNLQDFIQMTSDRFDKQDESTAKVIERLDTIEGDVRELRNVSYRHELQFAEFSRTQDKLNDLIRIDIKEIFTRLDAIEARLPEISTEEIRQLQAELQQAVDWIAKISKLKNISIKFPLK